MNAEETSPTAPAARFAAPTPLSEAERVCLGEDQRCANGEELLEVFDGLLKRHLAGYPGGASDIEEHFQAELAAHGVEDETLWTLSDALAESGLDAAFRNTPEPVTTAWIEARLGEDTREVLSRGNTPGDSVDLRAGYKYRLGVRGVRSERCGDDIGWEKGCDHEEPSVAHAAWGPGWNWITETNAVSIKQGEEDLFTQGTDLPASVPFSYNPLLHVWRVVENDPEQGNFSWANAAMASVNAVVKSFGGNWVGVAEAGIKLMAELAKFGGNGDDLYPIFFSYYDNPTLAAITSISTKTQPQPTLFFDLPVKSYFKDMAVYNTFVPGGWKVITTVTRTPL